MSKWRRKDVSGSRRRRRKEQAAPRTCNKNVAQRNNAFSPIARRRRFAVLAYSHSHRKLFLPPERGKQQEKVRMSQKLSGRVLPVLKITSTPWIIGFVGGHRKSRMEKK
uniref:Uncharacterized protein n=1 Tax=Caenorhabditis tropicalis TaxID=1561998 RepID=A0A1I7TIF3_9PELO